MIWDLISGLLPNVWGIWPPPGRARGAGAVFQGPPGREGEGRSARRRQTPKPSRRCFIETPSEQSC